MPLKTLQDALIHELKDLLSAEKQLVSALPKMAQEATNPELRAAFESHLKETENHVERLKQAFEALDRSPRSEKCEAMVGLIEEGSSLIEEDAEDDVKDAMLIASAQKVEHYEIASYGTLCTWAKTLGLSKVLKLLKQNMAEEEAADQKLTKLATTRINEEAIA